MAVGHEHVRPTSFVENQGQAPKGVLFQAQGAGFEASFSRDSFVLRLFRANPEAAGSAKPSAGVAGLPKMPDPTRISVTEQRISLAGASPSARIEPLDPLPGKMNFFRGNDPKRWVRGLATYARLRYKDVYPGVDLLFYSNQGKLEYDFVVAPGADPSSIRLRVEAGRSVHITENGVLQVGEGGEAVLHRPMLYQNLGSGKQAVEGKFVTLADNTVGFEFSKYDRSKTLVIDPTLSLLYSTYLGGYHDDEATGIALDAQNNSYIVGFSQSPTYPVSGSAYQTIRKNDTLLLANNVITKISPSGVLLYSTFLGGSTGETSGGIVLDSQGNAYIAGFTQSRDFPVTANAYQGTFPSGAASSAFFAELSPDGSTLVYSSFFGGSGGAGPGYGFAIARNPLGNVVISGNAGPGLPTTSAAYLKSISSGTAGFVAVFNLALSGTAQLVASTYYGATTPIANNSLTGNIVLDMALDSSGNPWIAGQSYTNNLPVTGDAYQGSVPAINPNCGGGPLNSVAYFAKLSADLSTLDYASYLSGKTAGAACSEYAHAITLDSLGNVYVAGTTASSAFPTTSGVFQQTDPSSGYSEFVARVSPAGALVWSTYLGGNGGYSFQDSLAIDSQNNLWVSGTTQGGSNFPLVNAYQATEGGGYDGHITEIKSDGTAVLYSTYLGGSGDDVAGSLALDAQGNVYVAGYTSSTNFPVTANAFEPQKAYGGPDYNGNDIFFTILGSGAVGVISPTSGGNTGDTTITVSGSGFESGASCAMVQGGTTIEASAVIIGTGGTGITCTFALNGAAPGSYNVVVTNPGSASLVSLNAFTVLTGGQPKIWTTVVGRSVIRTGVPSTFVVTVGNSGNVDAYFTSLLISLPSTLTFSLSPPLIDPADPLQTDYSQANVYQDSATTQLMEFIVPHLPPNATFSLALALTSPSDMPLIEIDALTRRPWFDSYANTSAALTAAQSGGSLSSTCLPNLAKSYLNNCLGPELVETSQAALSLIQTTYSGDLDLVLASLETTYAGNLLAVLNEGVTGISPSSVAHLARVGATPYSTSATVRPRELPATVGVVTAVGSLAAIVQAYEAWVSGPAVSGSDRSQNQTPHNATAHCSFLFRVVKACTGCDGTAEVELYLICASGTTDIGLFSVPCKKGVPNPPTACKGVSASARKSLLPPALSRLVKPRDGESCSADDSDDQGGASGDGASCSGSGGSYDPNDKSGLAGDGSLAQYVKLAPLSYNVAFENEASATLPAAQVVITDQLDPTKVDLTTVTLGSFAFGTNIITLPANTSNYNTTVNINSSLSVRIQGSLNSDTGLLKWTFSSIDPTTGLPPSDPTIGFLPPDTDGIKGQGSVQFSVTPKSSLTTGTPITNQASVVFDTNAPILTPTWLNTMDVNPPVSSVAALPSTESSTCLNLSWSGTDVGSGIVTYTIYVSDNGGPYTLFLTQTTTTSVTFRGQPGHNYRFYSVAQDGAGNVESKSTADTSTTVNVSAGTCSLLVPVITWSNPPNIVFGSALGAGTLNATANVPGTFVYSPPAGTVLAVGNAQTLSVLFTPTDLVNYTTANATVQINVIGPPSSPILVSPANGATGVSLTPTLSWNTSSGATSYNVYFGTSPTPPLATNTTATSYSPGTLNPGTVYYWQVVAENSTGSASSAIWSFTTQGPSTTSGTPNFIGVFTGVNSLGNSVMQQLNGNVGIGTVPGANAPTAPSLDLRTYPFSQIGMAQTTDYLSFFSSDQYGPAIYWNPGKDLRFGKGGASLYNAFDFVEQLRIQSATGNVGIGTMTPGSTLDVAGNINFTGSIRYQGSPLLQLPGGLASANIALGIGALSNITTGTNNIAIGSLAASAVSGGNSNNIHIGNQGSPGDSGTIRLGTLGTQSMFFAAGVRGIITGSNSAVGVMIDSNGQLGTLSSSLRFKDDIEDMGDASRDLMRLRPVTFRYKQPFADGSKPIQYGLIAEDVAKVYPDLVAHSADGQIETVKYQVLAPMLLNTVQRHQEETRRLEQRVDEQEQENQLLRERLAQIEAGLASLSSAKKSSSGQ